MEIHLGLDGYIVQSEKKFFARNTTYKTSRYLVINGTVFIGSELDSHPFYD